MHAAIIEFDTLADPVRAAAENNDFFPIGRPGFAFLFIGGIQISGIGGKFRRTGINALIDRADILLMADIAHFRFLGVQ